MEQLLNPVDEIENIEWTETDEAGATGLKITTEEKTDIREELFYLMAENKMPVLKMDFKKISLEDIFLELTEEHPEIQKEEKEDPDKETKNSEKSQEAEEINHDSHI